ncbi:uncharacterized protein DUF2642 [Bacillus oleivorans]|uniref:Uncharacterized protein DUF2642 n=1 Tax=Bacillus oleivorans TaxID=1448271 RepID=A0A285D5U4_9BACI|nr:DUF2642 domain-containing protein [Bacillus oleivorans]SNX74716.1 uncharacterized protein DUF2642 [Bacillus oleivorans]
MKNKKVNSKRQQMAQKTKNPQNRQNQQIQQNEPKLEEQTVNANFLASLVNEGINVNSSGPDGFEGTLLGAGKEHMAVQNSDGNITYYNLRHIKSVVKQKAKNNNNNNSLEDFEVVQVDSFADVLKAHKHKWIQVNSSKKDSLQGFLSEVNDDHIVLINDGEVSYISIYHIKNLNEMIETEEEQQEENQTQENNQNNNQNNNQQNQETEERDTGRRIDFVFDNRNLFRI